MDWPESMAAGTMRQATKTKSPTIRSGFLAAIADPRNGAAATVS